MSQTSMFSSEEPPVNPSRSLDLEKDWLTRAATSPSPFLQFLTAFAPAGWSGRTSPASYLQHPMGRPIRLLRKTLWTWSSTAKKWNLKTVTAEKKYTPSTPSWPDFQNSGTGGPTGFLTLNISEWPNDAAVCSLSDILETGPLPRRFFLSALACQGILRRAANRGKTLPEQLRIALEAVAESGLVIENEMAEPEENPDWMCQECKEVNSGTWFPTCEWCNHEQARRIPVP